MNFIIKKPEEISANLNGELVVAKKNEEIEKEFESYYQNNPGICVAHNVSPFLPFGDSAQESLSRLVSAFITYQTITMDEKEMFDHENDQEMENEDQEQDETDYKALSEQYKAQAEKEKARADKYE